MITPSDLIRALDYAPLVMSQVDDHLLNAFIYKISRVNELAGMEWERRQFRGMRRVETEETSNV